MLTTCRKRYNLYGSNLVLLVYARDSSNFSTYVLMFYKLMCYPLQESKPAGCNKIDNSDHIFHRRKYLMQ